MSKSRGMDKGLYWIGPLLVQRLYISLHTKVGIYKSIDVFFSQKLLSMLLFRASNAILGLSSSTKDRREYA